MKLVAFGECVLFKVPKGATKPGKLEEVWEHGVYVGFVIRSGESLIATPDGVFRVSDVRRRPLDARWSTNMLDRIVGTPETPVPGAHRGDRQHTHASLRRRRRQTPRYSPLNNNLKCRYEDSAS